eukprot:TRINITY_DN36034_c0_g1_i1.p1 TRINITY_DN36034_c0_g1~~TRINITY_DN36034_c0_g1_i1.p1  ORF type:complete len:320 (-),score=48.20 TRINITY_DN36034_c0_g1_i1:168-1058(-)
MGRLEDTLSWLINLITLAENLYTVFKFDEDKFGAMTIAVVLYCEPIYMMLTKNSRSKFGIFISDLMQEVGFCIIFMYFCSFTEDAVIVLPAMGAVQVLLSVVLYVKENCIVTPQATTKNQIIKTAKCCASLFFYLIFGAIPLPYLLCQDEAPFRQKPFEVVLTCYLWFSDIGMQAQNQKLEEILKGFGDTFEDAQEANEAIKNMNKNMPDSRVMQFAKMTQPAFFVYTSVLAWMYWFSGDIETDFDKGYTMFTMVMCSIMVCCAPLSMYIKFKKRMVPPEDGQPAGEQTADAVEVS